MRSLLILLALTTPALATGTTTAGDLLLQKMTLAFICEPIWGQGQYDSLKQQALARLTVEEGAQLAAIGVGAAEAILPAVATTLKGQATAGYCTQEAARLDDQIKKAQ